MNSYLTRFSLIFFVCALFVFVFSKPAYADGYTNVCNFGQVFSGYLSGPVHRCPVGAGNNQYCSTATGSCSASGTVIRHVCNGYHNECVSSTPGFTGQIDESVGGSMSVTNGGCDQTIQVDVFSINCRSGGGWNAACANNSALLGYLVYHKSSCFTPTPTSPPVNTCIASSAYFLVKKFGQSEIVTPYTSLYTSDLESLRYAGYAYGTTSPINGSAYLYGPTGSGSTGFRTLSATNWPYAYNQVGTYGINLTAQDGSACFPATLNLLQPTQPPCPTCTAVACPTGNASSKFRTTASQLTGTVTTCSNPPAPACPVSSSSSCTYNSYVNTPPTCSLKVNGQTGTVTISRNDPIANMELVVTDPDYGDTVEISTYDVMAAGATQIKNDNADCGLVRSGTGADPFGLVVRVGGSVPGVISQTTNLLFNQKIAHGIYPYNSATGRFECSGKLTVEVRDRVGDAYDSSNTATCSVDVVVVNDQPTLTSVELYDKDPDLSVRTSNDKIDGTTQKLWVSNAVTNSIVGKKCTSPVDLNTPGLPCVSSVVASTRRNPLELSFTVQDTNGINDIERMGIMLQRIDNPQNEGTAAYYPASSNNIRKIVSAVYSQFQDDTIDGGVYWISRADFSKNLLDVTTRLYGERYLGSGGGSSASTKQSGILPRGWAMQFFPDCYLYYFGCGAVNLSYSNRLNFTGYPQSPFDYIFDVSTPANSYLCYEDANTVSVRTGSCNSSCAACLRRDSSGNGIQQTGTNSLKATFSLQVNDSLQEGDYALFVAGLDKVGTNINKGREQIYPYYSVGMWSRIMKDDGVCEFPNQTGCASRVFTLGLDKTPPSFSVTVSDVNTTDTFIHASVNSVVDTKSGVSSESNIYKSVFYWVDHNNPSIKGFIKSARTNEGNCDGNTVVGGGPQPCTASGDDSLVNGKWEMIGDLTQSGIPAGVVVDIYAQYCIMDDASNGTCNTSPALTATFTGIQETAWIKTSLGPVYSNVIDTLDPFDMGLSTDSDAVDASSSSLLYSPFTQQTKSVVGSLLGAASSSATLGLQNAKLGFGPTYRNPEDTNSFTFRGYVDSAGSRYSSGWYTRLLSLFQYNCNKTGTNNCATFSTAQEAMTAAGNNPKYSIVSTDDSLGDTVCQGRTAVFVQSGTFTINGQITKVNGASCIFIVADGAKIDIADTVTGGLDKVYATFVVDGTFSTNKAGTVNDRLELFGGIFTSKNVPILSRKLSNSDNKSLPSEWLVYNATVLEQFRDWFGVTQQSDIKCGASGHPVCSQ